MNYRINQLQLSGRTGCVTATALNRPTLSREGLMVLTIGENVVVLNAEQCGVLAQFLVDFDPHHEFNGAGA